MGIRKLWWDGLSFLYLYASVLSLLLIPLWFTAGWTEYATDETDILRVGLHATWVSDGTWYYSLIFVALFLVAAVWLALPLLRKKVHVHRVLLVPKIIMVLTFLYVLLITVSIRYTVLTTDRLYDFGVQVGTVLLLIVAFASFALQMVISFKSSQYRKPRGSRKHKDPAEAAPTAN